MVYLPSPFDQFQVATDPRCSNGKRGPIHPLCESGHRTASSWSPLAEAHAPLPPPPLLTEVRAPPPSLAEALAPAMCRCRSREAQHYLLLRRWRLCSGPLLPPPSPLALQPASTSTTGRNQRGKRDRGVTSCYNTKQAERERLHTTH